MSLILKHDPGGPYAVLVLGTASLHIQNANRTEDQPSLYILDDAPPPFASQVWSWGSGKFGCLGLGDEESRWFPSRIPLFAESQPATAETISAGKWHVLCLTHKTHEVYAWGRNNWGQASESFRVCGALPPLRA